ncbi:uncharacterized protein LOC120342285 isoform X2 [Styela clava]
MGSRVQEHERSVDEKLSMYKGSNRDNSQENIENVENIAKIVERVVKKRSENKYKEFMSTKKKSESDLVGIKNSVQSDLKSVKSNVQSDLENMKNNVQSDLKSVKFNVQSDLENMKSIVQSGDDKLMRVMESQIEKILLLSEWFKASNNYFYKRFSEKVDYQTARNRCQQLGAQLISTGFRDPAVRSEIHSKICIHNTMMWIGLDQIERKDVWVWSDGTIVNDLRSVPWRKGEPNNAGGGENCGEYLCGASYNGVNDKRCNTNYAYACEKEFFHKLQL